MNKYFYTKFFVLIGLLPTIISTGSFTVYNNTNTEKTIKFDAIWCHRLGDSVLLTKEWWESKGVTGGVLGYTITGAGTNTDIKEDRNATQQAADALASTGIATGVVAGTVAAGTVAGAAAGGVVAAGIGSGLGALAAGISTAGGVIGAGVALTGGTIALGPTLAAAVGGAATGVGGGALVAGTLGIPLVIGGAIVGGVLSIAAAGGLGITALVLGILSANAEKQFSTRPCADGGKLEFVVTIAPGQKYSAGKVGVWYDVKLVNAEGASFKGLQGELYDEFHVPVDQDWSVTIE